MIAPILFAVFTWLSARFDAYLINNEEYISKEGHTARFCLRASVAIILATLQCDEVEKAITMMFWFGAFFWLFFDLLLNLYRGLPLFYVGKTSKIDQLFNRHPLLMHILKVALLATFTIIYKSL